MELIYIRSNQFPFTISRLMDQIVKFITKEREYPSTIKLPPEEYVFLNYIMLNPNEMDKRRITTFLDIPLAIDTEIQEFEFSGV